MGKLIKAFVLSLLLCGAVQAQTIGDALGELESRSSAVVSRQTGDTWGVRTAVDDLQRLIAQSQRLSASLSLSDARDVKQLEEGLRSAVRGVRTSKVMLADSEQQELDEVLGLATQVADRLTDMRLRFGGKANVLGGKLADLSLVRGDSDLPYENTQELLVDVRWTDDLVRQLMPARLPQPGGIGFAVPNNLDPLEVQRAALAIRNLERTLSTNLGDVRESIPAWKNFKQEYNRLNYMGPGRTVRMLEEAVGRLDAFYESLEG